MIGNKQSLFRRLRRRNKFFQKEKGFTPVEVLGLLFKRVGFRDTKRRRVDVYFSARQCILKRKQALCPRNSTGFTLIEVLAAVVIFSVVVLIVTGIFISILRVQRTVLATQEILDQTSYVLEYTSRALRMAKKDLTGACLSESGLNYELTASSGVKFIDYNNDCTEYYLENYRLKKEVGAVVSELTSQKLKVNYFKVILSGEDQNDNKQPKVTFSFEIESQRLPQSQRPQLRFQTTVSQRNLDVRY